MAKKNTSQLQTIIERGFKAIAEDIADVRKEMSTKNDIKNMATKQDLANSVASIMTELSDIKTRLKAVEEKVEDHGGHSKEIDHAFERIARIERHLGIKSKAH